MRTRQRRGAIHGFPEDFTLVRAPRPGPCGKGSRSFGVPVCVVSRLTKGRLGGEGKARREGKGSEAKGKRDEQAVLDYECAGGGGNGPGVPDGFSFQAGRDGVRPRLYGQG